MVKSSNTPSSVNEGSESIEKSNTGIKAILLALALSVSTTSAIAATQKDVASCMIDQSSVEEGILRYPSKIGACYIRFGNMAQNYYSGELEFLQSIKNEKGEDRSDLIELWTLSLEELYSARDEIEIDGGLIDFFQEFTPNMVKSWKGMEGIYGLMEENQQVTRENQQVTRENQQVTRENQQLTSILNKLGK